MTTPRTTRPAAAPARFDLPRRAFVAGAGASLAAPSVLRAQATAEAVVVETDAGRLRGDRRGDLMVFRGVRYGADPSGAGRFLPARAAPPWAGVRDARRLGTPSLQHSSTVYGLNEPAPGEDCLFLNVWAPVGPGRRPVMFYSHGGGFTTGSAGSTAQDGSGLAREHDVVVVATNHRLGLLGYLHLGELGGEAYAGSGNQGLADIVLALAWTRRNIAAFGGDPENIMLFGESGGGAKTSCLYAMPSLAPHFAKAAIQSGPAVRIGSPQTAAETTRMALRDLGLAPGDWRRLLEVPGRDILAVQEKLAARTAGGPPGGWRGIADFGPGGWGPILQPDLLPRHPFDPSAPESARDKPLIVGWADREAAFFAWQDHDADAFALDEAGLRRRLAQDVGPGDVDRVISAYREDRPGISPSDIFLAARSAQIMGEGSVVIAERKAAQASAPVYYYNLAYRSNRTAPGVKGELGAMHAIDIPLVFNTVSDPTTLAGDRPDRFAAARHMGAYWASFARNGRPTAPGQPDWRPYDNRDRATLVLDAQCRLVLDRQGAERRLWTELDRPAAA